MWLCGEIPVFLPGKRQILNIYFAYIFLAKNRDFRRTTTAQLPAIQLLPFMGMFHVEHSPLFRISLSEAPADHFHGAQQRTRFVLRLFELFRWIRIRHDARARLQVRPLAFHAVKK